jgi:putative DNA primase/helicase
MEAVMNSIAAQAQAFIERGFVPVPVKPKGKAPTLSDWPALTIDKINPSRDFHPKGNIGLILGEPSGGLVDIDLDCDEVERIADRFLPDTGMIWGHGEHPRSHRAYRVKNSGKTQQFHDPSDGEVLVEYRSNGGQTVVPPSTHTSGELIKFHCDGEHPVVDRDVLLQSVKELAAATLLSKHWPEGIRHKIALALSGTLLKSGWPLVKVSHFVESVCIAAKDDEIKDRLRTVEDTSKRFEAGEPTEGWKKLQELLDNKVAKTLTKWLGLNLRDFQGASPATSKDNGALVPDLKDGQSTTDIGNARRFINQHGNDVRYCEGLGWLAWNGKCWDQNLPEVELKAQKTAKSLFSEVSGFRDSSDRSEFFRFAQRSNNQRSLRDMLATARPSLRITPELLDSDLYLLPCSNGTLDLNTGALREHDRKDYITSFVSAPYDPHAECPEFDNFCRRIFEGDIGLIKYVQRAIGYSLTGSVDEQCFFIAYGTGANGKSTLMNIISDLLGETLAKITPVETLLSTKQGGSIPNDLARLRGARFVVASEPEAEQKMAEGLLKTLTGGDKIAARFLNKEYFEFTPKFKLWLQTNFKPLFSGEDGALWRRVTLIPFRVTIPKAEQDLELLSKLKKELPGILRWAVEGCLEWQKEGLNPPDSVLQATSRFQSERDYLQQFLNDNTAADRGETVTKRELHQTFVTWCTENEHEPPTQAALGRKLKRLGYIDGRKNSDRYWKGLRLLHHDNTLAQ